MPSLKAMAREAQKRPKAGASKQVTNHKTTIFKSTERVDDSDLVSETESESGSNSEEGSTVAPVPVAKVNGQKSKPVAASPEVESEEDDDEENKIETQGDVVTSNSHSEARKYLSEDDKTGSENESGSDSSSGGESESDSDQEHEARVTADDTSSIVEEETQASAVKRRHGSIYCPPNGFTSLSESNGGGKRVAEAFSKSNLAGKQLWYITAPASVPINAVKKVSLQDVQLGRPALAFSGRNYGFVEDQAGERDVTKVLIPDGNSTAYRSGHKAVDQTLRLQQIVQLQRAGSTGSPNSTVSATIPQRPVRKQPDGLKMRFRPIGFGNGKTGTIGLSSSSSDDISPSTDCDTDEETEDAPPVSQRPLDLDQASLRLSEHASKASESQDDTSSSGEQTDDSTPVSLADSLPASEISSGTSSNDMKEVPRPLSAPKKQSISVSRSRKRKLVDFQKDSMTSSSLHTQSKANHKDSKAAAAKPETLPVIPAGDGIKSEKITQRASEDSLQPINPVLSEKDRKKEIRRSKNKENSHKSENKRRESRKSKAGDAPKSSINGASPSQKARHTDSNQIASIENVTKKLKKQPANTIIHGEKGGTPRPSQAASTTTLFPRKESAILPPKFVRSSS